MNTSTIPWKDFCQAIKNIAQTLAIIESASLAVLIASMPTHAADSYDILLQLQKTGNITISKDDLVMLTPKGWHLAEACSGAVED